MLNKDLLVIKIRINQGVLSVSKKDSSIIDVEQGFISNKN